jgi:transcriptional adapter 2-alpha
VDIGANDVTAIDEAMLRKRIQDLQHYRRMGLTTTADIEKFDADSIRRVRHIATGLLCQVTHLHGRLKRKQVYLVTIILQNVCRSFVQAAVGEVIPSFPRCGLFVNTTAGESEGRKSHERDSTPKIGGAASGTGPPVRRPRSFFYLLNLMQWLTFSI